MSVSIVRIYDETTLASGYRVLVDRVWPRGITKQHAAIDQWMRDIAPSTELRKWFDHDVDRWPEFERRYRAELDDNPSLDELRTIVAEHPAVTLLYGAKDTEHNQAVVLKGVLSG